MLFGRADRRGVRLNLSHAGLGSEQFFLLANVVPAPSHMRRIHLNLSGNVLAETFLGVLGKRIAGLFSAHLVELSLDLSDTGITDHDVLALVVPLLGHCRRLKRLSLYLERMPLLRHYDWVHVLEAAASGVARPLAVTVWLRGTVHPAMVRRRLIASPVDFRLTMCGQ